MALTLLCLTAVAYFAGLRAAPETFLFEPAPVPALCLRCWQQAGAQDAAASFKQAQGRTTGMHCSQLALSQAFVAADRLPEVCMHMWDVLSSCR